MQLQSKGIGALWIDTIKIYDPNGQLLIENGYYDSQILASVDSSLHSWIDGSVIAWYINDEPKYPNFLPMRYVDSLIYANFGRHSTVLYNVNVADINIHRFGGGTYDDDWDFKTVLDTIQKFHGPKRPYVK